ncbi:MAG: AAA family ATPase, partial [Deltaproteobacteria bacterium]|nr:AAA family ATPase [Deltaproteobacteria bacterium]
MGAEIDIGDQAREVIAEEEKILAQVIAELERQFQRSGRQLTVNDRRARALTSDMVNATRDEDKQQLASDEAVAHGLSKMKREEVESLEKLLDSPYFARIVLEEVIEEPGRGERNVQREYRLGSYANLDCRIVDWRRAPVSKLYYEYREGDSFSEEIQDRIREGKVLLRRKLDIKAGVLRRISCSLGDFVNDAGTWKPAGNAFRPRAARDYGALPDVLALISPEQFRAITDEAEGSVLIQGIAGSGKTTVALYRLSWLTQQDAQLDASRALFLVRSELLKKYIVASLPALAGLQSLHVRTLAEWLKPEFQRHFGDGAVLVDTPPGVIRVKSSWAMARAVEGYVSAQRARMIEYLGTALPWNALPAEVRRVYDRAIVSTATIPLLRELSSAVTRLAPEGGARAQTLSILEKLERRVSLYREDILRILGDADEFLEQDRSMLLDRELLDLARVRTEEQRDSNTFDAVDMPLLLRLAQLKGLGRQRSAYQHIAVDEVQDMNPVELSLISGSVPNSTALTFVGDAAQELSPLQLFGGFEALRDVQQGRLVSLTVSHRSTRAIMSLADYVHGSDRTTGGRPGKPPLWFKYDTENGAVTEAINWITRLFESYPGSLAVVLCRTAAEARFVGGLLRPTFGNLVRTTGDDDLRLDEGILVADIPSAKGLEFPFGMLWNPSASTYPADSLSRNLLYTAITRIEERLCIVTWGRPSPLLPPKAARLTRVVDEEVVDEDDGPPLLLDRMGD